MHFQKQKMSKNAWRMEHRRQQQLDPKRAGFGDHPRNKRAGVLLRRAAAKQPKDQSRFEVSALPRPEEFCSVFFKKTKNNIYASICGLFGVQKTISSISGGACISPTRTYGRRKTRSTQRMVIKYVQDKLLGLGFKYLVIKCSGPGVNKRYIFKHFYKRFKIIVLKDVSPYMHNGCRPRAIRRV